MAYIARRCGSMETKTASGSVSSLLALSNLSIDGALFRKRSEIVQGTQKRQMVARDSDNRGLPARSAGTAKRSLPKRMGKAWCVNYTEYPEA